MLKKIFIGTEKDFRLRIPLTFYPLIGIAVYGIVHNPSLQISVAAKTFLLCAYALGFFLRVWGSSFLTSAIVVDAKAHAANLIDRGPFALMRHPLYAGAGLMLFSLVIFLPPTVVIAFFLYEALMGIRTALYEEGLMYSRLGDAYARYCARTGLYWPSLLRLHNVIWHDVCHAGQWGSAVLSEFIFVLFGLTLTIALYCENARLLYGGVVVFSFLGGYILKKFASHAQV